MKAKKIPERTCAACGKKKPKRELVRIVKTPEGKIVADLTGKANGRGTYLCRDKKCFEICRKGRKLDRAFREKVSDEVYNSLDEIYGQIATEKDENNDTE